MPPPEHPNTDVQSPDEQSRSAAASMGLCAVPGFDIESELGRGGFGVVFKARQVGLNRTVALKMVIAGPFADPSVRARFLIEAEAVAALEHPHVVRVHQFGEHHGFPYLVMEYLSGGTLAESIKRRGPYLPHAAAELMVKLCGAVAHAHARDILHRDIKPGNILLTADGEPRLADFGLAKVGRVGQGLSATGQVLGTAAYMSPEQAGGKMRELGPPTDIYALGATLYDLLVGRPPFVGDSHAVTLVQVLTAEPERLRALNPSVPEALEAICLKCLQKEPSARYRSVGALIADLDNFLAGKPVTADLSGAVAVLKPIPVSTLPAASADASKGVITIDHSEPVVRPPIAPSVPKRRIVWLLTGLLGLGLLCAAIAVMVIRSKSGTGVVVVEFHEPRASVQHRARNGRLVFCAPDGRARYTLPIVQPVMMLDAGKYTIKLEGADGLMLEPSEVLITDNHPTTVRLTLDPIKHDPQKK